jgi:DNA-binding transcriptional MerR regulator
LCWPSDPLTTHLESLSSLLLYHMLPLHFLPVVCCLSWTQLFTKVDDRAVEDNDEQFAPAEICSWFNIPRTTLFRWESLGDIPRAERGVKGERIYRREHLCRVADILRKKLAEEVQESIKNNPKGAVPPLELLERLYRAEFFADKNPRDGLRQLQGLALNRALSQETIAALANKALSLPPQDRLRAKIWSVLALNDGLST